MAIDQGDMNENPHRESVATGPPHDNPQSAIGGRFPLAMGVLAVLCVVVPFLTWYLTWFGRPLSDGDVEKYLKDSQNPRHVQHALSQIAERIVRRDSSAKRWYPQIAAMVNHPLPEIRLTAAWVMGQDNASEDFHRALARLLEDSDPMVRRNAALALVRFGDGRGRPELLTMLRPYTVRAPNGGMVSAHFTEGKPVGSGTLIARIRQKDGKESEIRSPMTGRVQRIAAREGTMVAAGDELVVIEPAADQIWEALRALYLVGQPEDLPDVERFSTGSVSDRSLTLAVLKQASLTAEAIRKRREGR
jgi:hypothetical protein